MYELECQTWTDYYYYFLVQLLINIIRFTFNLHLCSARYCLEHYLWTWSLSVSLFLSLSLSLSLSLCLCLSLSLSLCLCLSVSLSFTLGLFLLLCTYKNIVVQENPVSLSFYLHNTRSIILQCMRNSLNTFHIELFSSVQ